MVNKSDPLTVLLEVKEKNGLEVDSELIKECYQVQQKHQYVKDRDTLRKMKELIEAEVLKKVGKIQ